MDGALAALDLPDLLHLALALLPLPRIQRALELAASRAGAQLQAQVREGEREWEEGVGEARHAGSLTLCRPGLGLTPAALTCAAGRAAALPARPPPSLSP